MTFGTGGCLGARPIISVMGHRVSLILVTAMTIVALVISVRATLAPRVASDDEIHELLVDHVDVQRKSLGTIVGIQTARWVVKVGLDDEGFVAFAGQTAGYAANVAYDPRSHVGVVVLSNGAQDDGGLAWHLLRPAFPVTTAAVLKLRQERAGRAVAVDPELLDKYAGPYRVASGPTAGDVVMIERQAGGLILKSPTTPPQGLRLYAENDLRLFLTEGDVQVTFQTNEEGQVTGIVVRFADVDTAVPRIDTTGENR
jgi:hypothetical protein